mmetsp:Transcript_12167/g.9762  ORF Transcript_12167/g.9762 Transcript_12167/m.9762 type:complete len:129 (-) Transcript_12167:108-494(-)
MPLRSERSVAILAQVLYRGRLPFCSPGGALEFFGSHGQGRRGKDGAVCADMVVAIGIIGRVLLAVFRRLHRQDHQLARVEGDLPRLLPPQAHPVLAQPPGQDRPHMHEHPQDRAQVRGIVRELRADWR